MAGYVAQTVDAVLALPQSQMGLLLLNLIDAQYMRVMVLLCVCVCVYACVRFLQAANKVCTPST